MLAFAEVPCYGYIAAHAEHAHQVAQQHALLPVPAPWRRPRRRAFAGLSGHLHKTYTPDGFSPRFGHPCTSPVAGAFLARTLCSGQALLRADPVGAAQSSVNTLFKRTVLGEAHPRLQCSSFFSVASAGATPERPVPGHTRRSRTLAQELHQAGRWSATAHPRQAHWAGRSGATLLRREPPNGGCGLAIRASRQEAAPPGANHLSKQPLEMGSLRTASGVAETQSTPRSGLGRAGG